jgi:Zn-dependent metalloprotease
MNSVPRKEPGKLLPSGLWHVFLCAVGAAVFLHLFSPAAGAYVPDVRERLYRFGNTPAPPLSAKEFAAAGACMAISAPRLRPAGKAVLSPDNVANRMETGENGTPVFLDRGALNRLSPGARKSAGRLCPAERALRLIAENRGVFRIDHPEAELVVEGEVCGPDGRRHVRFSQSYRGIPVWGSGLTAHFDADGGAYALTGRYLPTPAGVDIADIRCSREQALEIARTECEGEVEGGMDRNDSPRLVIWTDPKQREPRLAWQATSRGSGGMVRQCFVDAVSGAVLEEYSDTPSGTPATASAVDYLGKNCTLHVTKESDKYTMNDPEACIQILDAAGKNLSRGDYPVLAFSKDNSWKDPLLVSAFNNARKTHEYFLSRGRSTLLGGKTVLYLVVHYTSGGQPVKNAFWAGGYAAFGDGLPYAAALDIVAHEITHGIVEKTLGLIYNYQSGALNEGFADFFGAMVDPDWEIGEDLPGGPLRNIGNPALHGLPADMRGFQDVPLRNDNGGVHLNMSIPSRAGYLTAESIGREKAARIWYSILANRYLSPRAQFTDLRLAALQAATDLYGENASEVRAVELAFDAVGITGENWTKPPEDHPARAGERWLLFMDDFTSRHLRIAPAGNVGSSVPAVERKIFYGSASPFTVAANGSVMAYIDERNNLWTMSLDTGIETIADSSGTWFSVEISPDGTRLAATRSVFDRTIYIFDLANPAAGKAVPIYTASTEGSTESTVRYVDAMDWDQAGEKLLFDAYHQIGVEGQDPIAFWDINLLDIASGIITRVKTPTEGGLQAGNPSFAETNDRYIVCDLVSFDQHINSLAVIDLYTLALKRLRDNGWSDPYPIIGHPRFSPDDRAIIFQQDDIYYVHAELYSLPLKEDKMTAAGEAVRLATGGFPRWLVRSSPPIGVREETPVHPWGFTLRASYPNPFNPDAVIPYTLHAPGWVNLTVYDAVGRKVAVLADSRQPAGEYAPIFYGGALASGVYHARLEVDGRMKSVKMLLLK